MSDAETLRLIEEMERALEAGTASFDPDAIAAWHQRFLVAVASAERGANWPDIVRRSRAVAQRIELAVGELGVQRDALKHEMEAQATGHRALKAYRPSQP